MASNVVITSAVRTPIGAFLGGLSPLSAPELGARAIRTAIEKSAIRPENVDECIMGQVLTAGAGQAPARQAAIGAGLPSSVPCMTINKVCGSGLKAVMLAADSIRLGFSETIVAGGQESMSQAPHLLKNSRSGYRLGDQKIIDSMVHDGLWDPYNNFHMGEAAELCVKEWKFSREEQDEFAKQSYEYAQHAQNQGLFRSEIVPVEIPSRKGTLEISEDEEPSRARFEKMPELRPAFQSDGTITAANASKIDDGASALIVTTEQRAEQLDIKPLAKVINYCTHAQDPKWFTTAPVGAIKKCLQQANLSASDIDLWEVNEAFSVVAMAAMKEFEIPREKLNIHGGAVALGHPIGASGARILTTLIHALHAKEKKFGLATLCIGGGEAVAMIVERV